MASHGTAPPPPLATTEPEGPCARKDGPLRLPCPCVPLSLSLSLSNERTPISRLQRAPTSPSFLGGMEAFPPSLPPPPCPGPPKRPLPPSVFLCLSNEGAASVPTPSLTGTLPPPGGLLPLPPLLPPPPPSSMEAHERMWVEGKPPDEEERSPSLTHSPPFPSLHLPPHARQQPLPSPSKTQSCSPPASLWPCWPLPAPPW